MKIWEKMMFLKYAKKCYFICLYPVFGNRLSGLFKYKLNNIETNIFLGGGFR